MLLRVSILEYDVCDFFHFSSYQMKILCRLAFSLKETQVCFDAVISLLCVKCISINSIFPLLTVSQVAVICVVCLLCAVNAVSLLFLCLCKLVWWHKCFPTGDWLRYRITSESQNLNFMSALFLFNVFCTFFFVMHTTALKEHSWPWALDEHWMSIECLKQWKSRQTAS